MKNRITRIISCFIFVALLPGNFAHAGSDALNKIFDVIQKIDSISKEKKKQEKKNRKGSQNQQGSGNQNGNSQQVGGGQNSGNRGISAFREQISCDKDYSGK
ncbi:MAG: hypothetical protein HAW59_01435, partial [Betaproteobacteria bacterium]|nr:hypothetical protein [Betaproteobacteria bacterium]